MVGKNDKMQRKRKNTANLNGKTVNKNQKLGNLCS